MRQINGMPNCLFNISRFVTLRGASLPGARDEIPTEHETDNDEFDPAEQSSYRMIVARLHYFALPRPDPQYTAKGASTHMANPNRSHIPFF